MSAPRGWLGVRNGARGALLAFACAVLVPASAAPPSERALVGYFPSWCHIAPLGCDPEVSLDAVPPAYTHVILAFAKPDFAWDGSSWAGSGLQFAAPPAEIKRQIATLHARNTRVLLAVGGATYLNWAPLAAEADAAGPVTRALAEAISSLGLDGLDVDYEADGADAAAITEYGAVIRALARATALAGPGKMLTLAAWSTGADCTPATGLGPCGGKASIWPGRAGRERLLFRDRTLFGKIAMISVMSYDAGGENFDAVRAYGLYRDLVPSRVVVNIGLEISPESWGESRLVATEADAVCDGSVVKSDQFGEKVNRPYAVDRLIRSGPLAMRPNANPRDGAMLWHIRKDRDLPLCGATPVASPQTIVTAARTLLDGGAGDER